MLKHLATVLRLVWAAGGDRFVIDRVAFDYATEEAGFRFEEVSNESAEFDRVRAASCEEFSAFDRPIPYAPRLVRCGGLQAISVDEGGDLQGWVAARIARLWRRRKRRFLFEYMTKTRRPMRDGTRDRSIVRKGQRWETKDYVDLSIGDSPAHLSGIGPNPTGKTMRGVRGPRKLDVQAAVDFDHNEQIAMNLLTRDFEESP